VGPQARSASVCWWFICLFSGACGALFVVSQLFGTLEGGLFAVDNLLGEWTFEARPFVGGLYVSFRALAAPFLSFLKYLGRLEEAFLQLIM
jgi:hypothetical protein